MAEARERGRFERFLMSIMGPPQVGENRAPEGYEPDAAAQLCDKCGASWDDHRRRHKDNITYLECPSRTR
jgi:hypothetical protein